MDVDSVSLLSLLTDNPQLIELGLFGVVVVWLLLVSQAGQTLKQRRWEADLAAKEAEIQALQSTVGNKEQALELFQENLEVKLAAKDAALERFQSILEAKDAELQGWRERLQTESGMYRDIISAKDEKFELQQTLLKSLEDRYTQEIKQFQQRYDAMVNQRSGAIGRSDGNDS